MLRKLASAAVALGLILAVAAPALAKKWSPEEEKQIGRQVCAEIEKRYKRLNDPKKLKLIQQIVADIVPHTERPDVKYDIRLLNTDEVNAFSIPGGFIYVTKGLLNEVQSVHELAGVLAHEIAHNCHYDALRQAERSQRMAMTTLGAALLAILLGAKSDVVAGTVQAGLLIRQGILSRYSIDIEARADRSAVKYLVATGKYNPVGLLTFMERLARKERREVPPDAGIFQTHPLSRKRVAMLIETLLQAGVKINRRATMNWQKPKLVGKETPALVWWNRCIFTFRAPADPNERTKRAQAALKAFTSVLADGAQRHDFEVVHGGDCAAIRALDREILRITPEDAKALGKSVDDLAARVLQEISNALAAEELAYSF